MRWVARIVAEPAVAADQRKPRPRACLRRMEPRMKSNLLEQRLVARIDEKLSGAAPGLRLQVHQNGRKLCDLSVGDTYLYYDLASLTKIIFTVPALMIP